jgi:hypothetical protein
MSISNRVVAVALGAAVLATFPAVAEDFTITYKATGPKGDVSNVVSYFSDNGFRSAHGDGETIFEAKTGKIVILDNRRKEYWETTIAEMNAAMQAAGEQLKQAQEQMKGNPMAEKMMAGLLGAGGAAEVKVEKVGAARKLAGYDCEPYLISVGTSIKTETCLTTALVPPAAMYDVGKAMFSGNPMAANFQKMQEEMKKLKGFSLAETSSTKIMGMSTQNSKEAVEVKRGPIPASAFAVPAGYKQVESPYKAMRKGR